MNRRLIVLTAVFTGGSIACSEPSGPPSIPEWANETNWVGTVTMQTGSVFEVKVHLKADNRGDKFGPGVNIYAEPSSLKNLMTGVEISGFGFGDNRANSIRISFFIPSAITVDGPVPTCAATPAGFVSPPQYLLEATQTTPGEFHGTMKLHCTATNFSFEVRTIILRRL